MKALDAIKELTDNAYVYTVLIECEAAMAGASWSVVLSDNHARKGVGKGRSLEDAADIALRDLNNHCGGQITSYL